MYRFWGIFFPKINVILENPECSLEKLFLVRNWNCDFKCYQPIKEDTHTNSVCIYIFFFPKSFSSYMPCDLAVFAGSVLHLYSHML